MSDCPGCRTSLDQWVYVSEIRRFQPPCGHPCVDHAKALGAAGVQMGSAYLCSDEASTSTLHRAALQSPAARHTALTNVFTGRPARGIVNRVMRELGPISPLAPAFPLATAAMAPLRAAAEALGRTDFSPLWSGQNAAGARSLSAADITRDLAQGWHTQP